jgi:hypothetical protein
MTPKSKLIASAATALVLASMASFTVHAQATRPVAGGAIKVGGAAALRTSSSGQRHLVRVVDVTATPCESKSASAVDPNAIEAEKIALLAHRARLEAEMAGRQAIALPEELRGRQTTEAVERAFRDETVALQARQAQISEQIEAVLQSIELLKRETEIIQTKDTMMERQVSLLQEQLDTVDALLKRGSATVSQKLALEQTMAQYESNHLDLQLSALRSRQEWLKAQQSVVDVRNQLRTQDLVELSQTQARLADLSKPAAAEASTPKPSEQACDQTPGPVFEIVRGGDGSMQVLPIAPIPAKSDSSTMLPK